MRKLKKTDWLGLSLVPIVLGLTISPYIMKKPLEEIQGIPLEIQSVDNGDQVIDVYEGVKYAKKAFDFDQDGKLNPEEMKEFRRMIESMSGRSWYGNVWHSSLNLVKSLDHIELEQKLGESK